MVGERAKGESTLAYDYFCIYRDMRPRSLEKLAEKRVRGKTRTATMFKRWSKKHNWQDRVRDWDIELSREIALTARLKRQQEVEEFLDADFVMGRAIQRLAMQAIKELREKGECSFNTLQFRQVTMAYKEGRSNLKELIGFLDADADREFAN